LPESERSTDQATLRTIERQRNAARIANRLGLRAARLERVGERTQVPGDLRRKSLQQRHQLVTDAGAQKAPIVVGRVLGKTEPVSLEMQEARRIFGRGTSGRIPDPASAAAKRPAARARSAQQTN